jgi:signal transduction histidine kinase
MFLDEKAIRVSSTTPCDFMEMAKSSFVKFLSDAGCEAGLLAKWDSNIKKPFLICSYNLPDNPFNVSHQDIFTSICTDILLKNPSPHLHNIKGTPFYNLLTGIINVTEWSHRTAFIPLILREDRFLIFAFSRCDEKLQQILKDTNGLSANIATIYNLCECEKNRELLHVMQTFVREVGHDIASSVQAITAKIAGIRKGFFQGELMNSKLVEAEAELISMYRSADHLGITIDPDYNLSNCDAFDARDIVNDVLKICSSEAAEHHISFVAHCPDSVIQIYGDKRALTLALLHLVMNGIKYAKGSTQLTVSLTRCPNLDEFLVSNFGKPIDDDEKRFMWNFGWRGKKAKEMHVNGSGIGLYTVKKIVAAHGGTVGLFEDGSKGDRVSFYFSIPPRSIHLKARLFEPKTHIYTDIFRS